MTDRASSPPISRRAWWAPPCFLTGLAAIVWGLYVLGKPYYAEEDVRTDLPKVEALADARFIVLGASHAKGIGIDAPDLDGQNLYHNGQDVFEMAYIARSAVARAPHLKYVVLTLSYFSFGFDNAAYERHGVRDRIGRRIEMYSAFPRLGFVPGDQNEWLKGLLFPIVTRDHFQRGFVGSWKRVLAWWGGEGARKPRKKRHEARPVPAPSAPPDTARAATADSGEDDGEVEPTDEVAAPTEEAHPAAAGEPARDPGEPGAAPAPAPEPARRAPRKGRSHKDAAFYARHAASRCRQYAGLLAGMRARHPNIEADTYDEVLGLVRELEAKHLTVVLVTPPDLPAYTSCFDARLERLTRSNGARLSRETKARYLDLSTDPEFTENQVLFMDSDHLRQSGRNMVSTRIAELLGLTPAPPSPAPPARP
jgi:hypothetical protein